VDVVALHERCVEEFVRRVRAVPGDKWASPTPCPGWNVRELVNHVVGEELWTVPMMAGATIEQVGDRFAGDVLGQDPVATAERAAREAVAAIAEPVRAGRITHLSFGDTPAEEYARQLSADHLVHAWDLAVSVGADAALPADVVGAVAGWFAERERWYRASGVIGERPDADDRGDPRRRLLIAFGRHPDWTPAGEG
jgi:uncharacterized protein (TIGR03086 family)